MNDGGYRRGNTDRVTLEVPSEPPIGWKTTNSEVY